MSHLLLRSIEHPWGDYGHVLYHGMSMHAGRSLGQICLERTGPEIFPITFPIDIIVTADFIHAYSVSGLSGAEFRPVIKHHIVELDWTSWDPLADEPSEYPEGGEPEGYILDRPHSATAAKAMPDLFELMASRTPSDIYYLPGTKVAAVSPKAREWFTSKYGDYVSIVQKG